MVAAIYLWSRRDDFLALGSQPIGLALENGAWLIGLCFLVVSGALILIAAIDVPFQLWDHAQKLKMTLQEVRDEMKDTEGKPEVRARVRQVQQEMAQRRMMEAVPEADVIITNPTHYAVALKYDQARMRAPVVVALGRDLVALKMREIGAFLQIEIPQLLQRELAVVSVLFFDDQLVTGKAMFVGLIPENIKIDPGKTTHVLVWCP